MKLQRRLATRVFTAAIASIVCLGLVAAALLGFAQSAPALTVTGTIYNQIGEDPEIAVLSADESTLYVGSEGSVQIIPTTGPNANQVARSIALPCQPVALEISPDNTKLYMVPGNSGCPLDVYVYDVATGAQINTFNNSAATDILSAALSPDGSTLWVSTTVEYGTVYIFDTTSGVQTGSFTPPYKASEMVFAPDGSLVYLASTAYGTEDGYFYAVNPSTFAVTGSASLSSLTRIEGIAVSPNGQTVAITDWWNDQIYVITNPATPAPVSTKVQDIHDAEDVTFSADSLTVYVTGSDGVSSYVPSLGGIPIPTAAGDDAWGIAITSTGVLYVTNEVDNGYVTVMAAPNLAPAGQTIHATPGVALPAQPAWNPTGFNATPSYSISPAVSNGLSFSTTTGLLSGTPTVAAAPVTYTVQATSYTQSLGITFTNIAATTVTLSLTWTTPTLSPASQSATALFDKPFASTALMPANFSGTPSYALSGGTLPTGLQFNTQTGVVSGTPLAASPLVTYTITATSGIAMATATLALSVQPVMNPGHQNLSGTVNQAVGDSGYLVIGMPTGPSYSVSPALPAGLVLNPATGAISGSLPTASAGLYTVTASSGGLSAHATVYVNIAPVLTPVLQVVDGDTSTELVSVAPTAAGFPGAVQYSVSPRPPRWLRFDSSTGVLSGTPPEVFPPTSFVITGSSGAVRAAVTVSVSAIPELAVQAQTVYAMVGVPIAIAQSARSFDSSVSFEISPSLPAGLVFNTSSGLVSGTPTSTQPPTTYRVTARDGSFASESTVTLSVQAAPSAPNTTGTGTVNSHSTETPSAGVASARPTQTGSAPPSSSAKAEARTSTSAAVQPSVLALLLAGLVGAVLATTAIAGMQVLLRRRNR